MDRLTMSDLRTEWDKAEAAPFADFHTLTAELRSIRDDIAHLRAQLAELRRMVLNTQYRTGVPDEVFIDAGFDPKTGERLR